MKSKPHKTNVPPKTPLKQIVIIFKENHGFDNYFGTFPGVNGVS